MEIKFKKLHPNAVTPAYSRDGDAAVDLTAVDYFYVHPEIIGESEYYEYSTGLAVEIPKGYVGLIYPRSSLSKYDLIMANHVGVIDSNYRGEIKIRFKETPSQYPIKNYNIGDRIAQLIIQPISEMSFVEVSELTPSNRGAAGWGSSGA